MVIEMVGHIVKLVRTQCRSSSIFALMGGTPHGGAWATRLSPRRQSAASAVFCTVDGRVHRIPPRISGRGRALARYAKWRGLGVAPRPAVPNGPAQATHFMRRGAVPAAPPVGNTPCTAPETMFVNQI